MDTDKIILDTSRKGTIGEYLASVWLLQSGYEVFRNMLPSGKADLIAVRDKEVLFIDVGTLSPVNGRLNDYKKNKEIENIKIIYVLPDGTCHWRSELFPDASKVACKICKNEFIPNKKKTICCSPSCTKANSRECNLRKQGVN